MFLQRGSRVVKTQWQVSRSMARLAAAKAAGGGVHHDSSTSRWFHGTRNLRVVKPVILADIGEGIVECEIIQWFVEPGARVEEFSPLCEVQSDKASVEITSRFSGVVKKLHYDAGDMAKVGKPFVDIDIQGGAKKEDLEALTETEPAPTTPESPAQQQQTAPSQKEQTQQQPSRQETQNETAAPPQTASAEQTPRSRSRHASLATPAVRHLSKAMNVDISEIEGTGKDGRVLKEDVQNFIKHRESGESAAQTTATPLSAPPSGADPALGAPAAQVETRVPLTNTQQQMFKSMTRSLTIPHFLYADEVDFSSLVELRTRLNRVLATTPEVGGGEGGVAKLSYLPFIIKAVSMALYQFPILNARVDLDPSTSKPSLVMRSQHNIGVAMDTPSGLLVPVIRNVGSLNIISIASELTRLQKAAFAGKLTPADLGGGTITVSNIGNIGGTYLSPVIVDREVAILGIGRMRAVPAFAEDGSDRVVRKHVCNFSWSADHRVVDGATMARAAEVIRRVVEEPDVMVMHLR
ncbi:Lipoamide acyltransferase component of branched-chain alpha-keto acid dehydrogenase complex, mitochondrial [Colletotrichum chlorophyti]|uniref:Dihydrolipoamide acetyltransferase component of pyruvate dehydrogenase complex n=1 Tax=Colletotrichum chlorophyti TaxID=708187 RepID=A0A1Q8RVJ0_9PEZI|nr:Lipoamide acyltransferase component of branched-chain alpha-keto acid dehydrogenase complex, mitochondrial [Colletotrichum chlorophyti]